MGLSTSAQLLEIDEDGFDHHRALGDSLLSLRCLQKLYTPESLAPLCKRPMQSFTVRIQFKTVVICDLSNPLIKRSDMLFNCDVCGRRAHRVCEWQLKNKSYRAEFHLPPLPAPFFRARTV